MPDTASLTQTANQTASQLNSINGATNKLGFLAKSKADVSKSLSLNGDINELNTQICADWNLIHQLEQAKDGSLFSGFKKDIAAAINELEEMKTEMEGELEEFATGITSLSSYMGKGGMSEEEMFDMLFNPFMEALKPIADFLPTMGIPDLPIINNIPKMIDKIVQMGRLIKQMDPETVARAREEAEAAEQTQKAINKLEAEKRQAGMTPWQKTKDNFKHSKFGQILTEIYDLLKDVLQIIMMIAQNIVIFAILELIRIAKPVIDAFQLAVGTIVTLLENVYTLVRLMFLSSAQMLKYFWKLVEKKLSGLYYMVYYAASGGWSLPENYMISAAYQDIVSCELEISGLIYELNDANLKAQLSGVEDQLKSCEKKTKKITTMLDKMKTKPSKSEEILANYRKDRERIEKEAIPKLNEKKKDISDQLSTNLNLSAAFDDAAKKEYTDMRLLEFMNGDLYLSACQEKLKQKQEELHTLQNLDYGFSDERARKLMEMGNGPS